MPSPRAPRRILMGRRLGAARGKMGLRRPLVRTRAQTAVRAAFLVSIATVNAAACLSRPRTRERALAMRAQLRVPHNMAALSELDFRLLFRMERSDFEYGENKLDMTQWQRG